MYRQHLSGLTVFQNALIPVMSSCFLRGFTSLWIYSFSSCYPNSIGFRGLGRCCPPVDANTCIVCSGQSRTMLWIIVLNETMAIWIDSLDEWHDWSVQDGDQERHVHFSLKHAQICLTTAANPSPNMNLDSCALLLKQVRHCRTTPKSCRLMACYLPLLCTAVQAGSVVLNQTKPAWAT